MACIETKDILDTIRKSITFSVNKNNTSAWQDEQNAINNSPLSHDDKTDAKINSTTNALTPEIIDKIEKQAKQLFDETDKARVIAEAYHQALIDDSNEKLVKAVENNLSAKNVSKQVETTKRDIINNLIIEHSLSVSEATEIANLYYKEYSNNLKKKPPKELSKMDKVLRRNATNYLNFESDSPLLSEGEITKIRELYEKADKFRKAGAYSKASDIETEVATLVLSKTKQLTKLKIFESFLYTKPLTSFAFFTTSLVSNYYAHFERVVTSAFATKQGINISAFRNLFSSKYGLLKAISVIKGGNPIMDTYSVETSNIDTSRPEKIKIGGLTSMYAFFTQYAKRMIDSPDSLGQTIDMDARYAELLANKKYRELIEEGKTHKEAKKIVNEYVINEMQKLSKSEAMGVADKVFKVGEEVDESFRNTTEYKLAVEEIKRSKWDEATIQRAFLKSSEDYFKEKMTRKSELGNAYSGVMGVLARFFGSIKETLVKGAETSANKGNFKTAKLQKALGFGVFGFLSGSSAFTEKSLEIIPIYGAAKMAALQFSKKNIDKDLRTEIAQKQREIATKVIVGALLYAAMRGLKALLEENCDNKNIKLPESTIFGKHRTSICGKQIPIFLIPTQLELPFAFYNWVFDTTLEEKQDNVLEDALGVLLLPLSSTRFGNETDSYKMMKELTNSTSKNSSEVSKKEAYLKAMNYAVKIGVNYANSFLPIPTRPLQEIGSYINPKQTQYEIPIDRKDPNSFIKGFAKIVKYNLANVASLGNYINFFSGTDNPILDWQGREVMNLRVGYWAGDGVQYNKYDNLFAQASAPLPYINPMKEIEVSAEGQRKIATPLSKKGRKIIETSKRYLTPSELFEAQKSVGKFNIEFIKGHFDNFMGMSEKDRNYELNSYSKRVQYLVFKGLGDGVNPEELYGYLMRTFKSKRELRRTDVDMIGAE